MGREGPVKGVASYESN